MKNEDYDEKRLIAKLLLNSLYGKESSKVSSFKFEKKPVNSHSLTNIVLLRYVAEQANYYGYDEKYDIYVDTDSISLVVASDTRT